MNISKHIRLLVFTLLPASLLGMEIEPTTPLVASNWLAEARRTCLQTGSWTATDKKGNTVIVEGELISPDNKRVISSENALRELAAMYADVMQAPDLDLMKAYLVTWLWFKAQMLYQWKSYRDIIYAEYIDEINEILAQKNNDLAYIFTVSELGPDSKKLLLGSVVFGLKENYTHGTVELFHFVVRPEAQGRNLSTILASAIFNFLPQIKRIFLDTTCTNYKAQAVYESWGFTKYENKREELGFWEQKRATHCVDYEYLTDRSTKLQDVAATFKEI